MNTLRNLMAIVFACGIVSSLSAVTIADQSAAITSIKEALFEGDASSKKAKSITLAKDGDNKITVSGIAIDDSVNNDINKAFAGDASAGSISGWIAALYKKLFGSQYKKMATELLTLYVSHAVSRAVITTVDDADSKLCKQDEVLDAAADSDFTLDFATTGSVDDGAMRAQFTDNLSKATKLVEGIVNQVVEKVTVVEAKSLLTDALKKDSNLIALPFGLAGVDAKSFTDAVARRTKANAENKTLIGSIWSLATSWFTTTVDVADDAAASLVE